MDWKRTSTLIYPGSEKRKSPATSDVDTFPGVLEKATWNHVFPLLMKTRKTTWLSSHPATMTSSNLTQTFYICYPPRSTYHNSLLYTDTTLERYSMSFRIATATTRAIPARAAATWVGCVANPELPRSFLFDLDDQLWPLGESPSHRSLPKATGSVCIYDILWDGERVELADTRMLGSLTSIHPPRHSQNSALGLCQPRFRRAYQEGG